MIIKKKESLSTEQINSFLNDVSFKLPAGFIDFFKKTNGGEISNDAQYIILWPLTEMVRLNEEYNVSEYASGYFIFGSDGGDIAYCIEKKTGFIFDIPFIGMSNDDVRFRYKSFTDLLGAP